MLTTDSVKMGNRKEHLPLSTCLAAVCSVKNKVRKRRVRSDRAPRSAITFTNKSLQASGTPVKLPRTPNP